MNKTKSLIGLYEIFVKVSSIADSISLLKKMGFEVFDSSCTDLLLSVRLRLNDVDKVTLCLSQVIGDTQEEFPEYWDLLIKKDEGGEHDVWWYWTLLCAMPHEAIMPRF